MTETKKLFLFDAYALIYRSYYAFIRNPRINSKGMNTSAIFGFLITILDIIRKENPTHLAFAFDLSAPTFRHELFSEYKANREATPEDIQIAIPYIKNIIKALNISIIEKQGFEADDIIGTISVQADKEGYNVFMVTPDKDYGQLISENVFMYKPGRSGKEREIVGINEICESFSINDPKQVVDILGLWGDASDNIPGAPGIGEKGAKKLIGEYGSIENLIERSSELSKKQHEILTNNVDQIKLSKELATIITDVPIEFNVSEYFATKPNIEILKNILDELEFKSILDKIIAENSDEKTKVVLSKLPVQGDLFGTAKIQQTEVIVKAGFENMDTVEHKYILVDDDIKLKELIVCLSNQKEFSFDTETTGLDVFNLEIVGLSFSFKKNEGFYVPMPNSYDETINVLAKFKNVFGNEKILKIGQNIKYDIHVLRLYQIDIKGKIFDTMLAHYLLEPDLRHNLTYLSETYLNYTPVEIEALIGKKGKNQMSMRNVPREKISDYACEDADLTFRLKEILNKELEDKLLVDLFYKLEMPLVNVLISMEEAGFLLDIKALNNYSLLLSNELNGLESNIYSLANTHFNISSPKQLGEILFEKLEIESKAKTSKTKQYSTGEEVLINLKNSHPIINYVLEYRSVKKLLSTYVEALPKLVNYKTQKIHTSFNQAVASTGRLSSASPNLQNIPIRDDRGKEIRKSFLPSEGNILLAADYSQVELRLMAHLSNNSELINAFLNNEDIHKSTAAKIYKVELNDVTKEMRSKAKTANFGIIYGISTFGLSQRLNIPRGEAKVLIEGYFSAYPGVKEYMDKCIQFARDNSYVQTIMGRRRILKDINSRNAIVRGFAERNAINAPIQGSAADIIKLAMININQKINEGYFKTKMILQVHDELIFDVLPDEMDQMKLLVKNEMENTVNLKVPLLVDIGTGCNWLEAH